jgi:flagellar motility protein MotE (MotC chaperone)
MSMGSPPRWSRGLASAAGLLVVSSIALHLPAGSAATAQQGWAPAVSIGPGAGKETARPAAKTSRLGTSGAAERASSEPNALVPFPDVQPTFAPRAAATAAIETGSTTKSARAEEYCTNIADAAADARFAWQKKVLTDLEQQIAHRIAQLEEKTAEYRTWLARRDEFSQKANATLLRIYSRMRPDAAAAQIAELDEETAAALLTNFEGRTASLILNEMDAGKAARLSSIISGAAQVVPAAKPATQARAQ